MDDLSQGLRWAPLVRFLQARGQTLVTHLGTGSFLKIRSEAFAAVQETLTRRQACSATSDQEEPPAALSTLLRTLRDGGYLVSPEEEAGEARTEAAVDRWLRAPKIAYFAVSDACNLACPFCYADAPARARPYRGDTARALAIVDRLATLGVVHLLLSGGEPLLRADLPEIAQAAKARRLLVGVTTNGTLLGPAEAAALRGAGVDYVQVSLESPDPAEHDALRGRGTWERSVQAVRSLREQGYPPDALFVTATTLRPNVAALKRFRAFAEALGATPGASFFQPVGRGLRTAARLACSSAELRCWIVGRMAEKRDAVRRACAEPAAAGDPSAALVPRVVNCCGMGERTIGVKEDGTVVPCHLFFSSAGAGLGNVLDADVAERLIAFTRALPTVDEVEGCRDCQVRYFCGNGCWAHVHAAYGTFDRRNPYCDFYQRYFSAVVWNLGLEGAMERIYEELAAPPPPPEQVGR